MSEGWFFAPHEPGLNIYNPLGGEHFNQGAVGDADWEPGESLVRECIQNSLDARASDQEVTVVFQVTKPESLPLDAARFWFGSLWPHLRSDKCKLGTLAEEPVPTNLIVVEDFETRGLQGDVNQWGISDSGSTNDFFSFFRAEGLSGKTNNSGGSWGVGKSVFNRCSSINTFLALSVRERARDAVLIGKSLLWHHKVGDKEFQAVGQFGRLAEEHARLVLPATNAELLRRAAKDFGIRRRVSRNSDVESQPGLSVVVPYADPEITAESLLSVVIREYFQPILAGRLRVIVEGVGPGARGSVCLDHESIEGEAARLKRADISGILSLARWAKEIPSSQAYSLSAAPDDLAPAWQEAFFRPEDPAFRELCAQFEAGEPVAIQVPIQVHPSQLASRRSHFTVFMRRDLVGDGYRPVFVRAGIVVPNARERGIRGHSIFVLVTIDDEPLALMLRAAEPPAHTTWSHTTANFKGLYEFGKQSIDFVVGAPKFIADTLSSARTERDLDVWADFFPEPDATGMKLDEGTGKKGKKRISTQVEPPISKPKPFRIDIAESAGGFKVVRDNAAKTALPEGLEILVAYDTSRGNPLKKYHPADFKLPDMRPDLRGLNEMECKDNMLRVKVTNEDFSIEVTGFDTNRDLIVRVRSIEISTTAGGGA